MMPQPENDSTLPGDKPLETNARDRILDSLLAHNPPPHVMAVDEVGLTVPMPDGVTVARGRRIEGVGSALELCVTDDLTNIVHAWWAALRVGQSYVTVHLRIDPDRPVTLHFVDARHRYGVFFAIFVGHDGVLSDENDMTSVFRPRLCRMEFDGYATVCEVDDAAPRILGWTREQFIGMRILQLLHPDEQTQAIARWMETLAKPDLEHRQLLRHLHSAGHYVWFEITHRNRLDDPASGRIIAELIDVTDRMEAVEALRASEQLLRRLTEALPLGIVQTDAARRIVYRNERIAEIVGQSGSVTFAEQFALAEPNDGQALETALDTLVADGAETDLEISLDHPDGARRCSIAMRPLTNEAGSVTGAIVCVADVTERLRLRDELETRATFDNLTGCYNRASLLHTLAAMVQAADWPYTGIAVLFIDLDRFKQINDRLGHAAGDDLLRCVGQRLTDAARSDDVVGRLGGDEFLVVCPDVDSPATALAIARRFAATLAEVAIVGSQSIEPSASIGVAWSEHPLAAEALVAAADSAMYESKHQGTGPVLATPSEAATATARG